jgi:hypothetical protein
VWPVLLSHSGKPQPKTAKNRKIYKSLLSFAFQFNNVNSCLNILRQQSVGGLENITANDICSGRLKAVLSLFFALSRYKQATKQKAAAAATGGNKQSVEPSHIQQSTNVVNENMTNR